MREIKFRAWSKPNNKMYFQLNESPCFGLYEGDRAVSIEDVLFYEKQDFELMQYTGLIDKNGVEIYEGDIIRKKFKDRMIGEFNANGRVIFGKWFAGFTVNYIYYDVHKLERLSVNKNADAWIVANRDMEVIGNIYENPNLLEGGE